MPEFVVVRHGRPLTERLESGIADPSLDGFGASLRLAGPRAGRRRRGEPKGPRH